MLCIRSDALVGHLYPPSSISNAQNLCTVSVRSCIVDRQSGGRLLHLIGRDSEETVKDLRQGSPPQLTATFEPASVLMSAAANFGSVTCSVTCSATGKTHSLPGAELLPSLLCVFLVFDSDWSRLICVQPEFSDQSGRTARNSRNRKRPLARLMSSDGMRPLQVKVVPACINPMLIRPVGPA